jgi:hypothetical protein
MKTLPIPLMIVPHMTKKDLLSESRDLRKVNVIAQRNLQ